MGKACCGTPGKHTYEFNGKKQTIKTKDAVTIERFAKGASARIAVKQKKEELAKEIADLKKPSLSEPNTNKDTLLTHKEWIAYMDEKNEGKDLIWNNYWTPVDQKREYKGEFKKENKAEWEGLGYIKYQDGSMYAGQVKDKKMNGKGRMTYKDGTIYQGQWVDGKAEGKGVFVDKVNGTIYEGQWKADKQHGQGVETWNEGQSVYKGEFVQGSKTGKARYESDGNVYEGDFLDGEFHGKGKYYFVDTGKTYEGQFEDNEMHGKGKMTWPDQSRYEGDFNKGKAAGHGVEYLTNGDKYIGEFDKELKHGAGVYYNTMDQTKRQGEWQNGKRIAWLSQPQSTTITSDNTQIAAGKSASRMWQGARWQNDFKAKLNNKYKLNAANANAKTGTVSQMRASQMRGLAK